MSEAQHVISTAAGGKSLKDQNRWQLWLAIVFNSIFLYGISRANAIEVGGLSSALASLKTLVPIGFALMLTTVANGLLTAETKARLVFLRWHHSLPGHRAFSRYVGSDPRVDPATLLNIVGSPFPVDPVEQNRTWYQIYKGVAKDPAVAQVHRDFLLLRDYTGLSALMLIICGILSLYAIGSVHVRYSYLASLLLQYFVVRQAAANYGVRMVTTVLALSAVQGKPHRARHPRKPALERSQRPKKEQAASSKVARAQADSNTLGT